MPIKNSLITVKNHLLSLIPTCSTCMSLNCQENLQYEAKLHPIFYIWQEAKLHEHPSSYMMIKQHLSCGGPCDSPIQNNDTTSSVKKNLSYSYLFPSYPQNKRNKM